MNLPEGMSSLQRLNPMKIQARKYQWRKITGRILIAAVLAFNFYNLYYATRYGAVLIAWSRNGPLISYNTHKIAFIFLVIFFSYLPFIGCIYVILSALGQHTPWERKLIRKRIAEELARTRPRFEDENIVEPYDRSGPPKNS